MLIFLDESTAARRRVPVALVDATDGVTPETGVTLSAGDMKISKNGAAEANHAGSLVEQAGGDYYYEFTAGEVNTLGMLKARIVKSGVRTFRIAAQVVAFDPYATPLANGDVLLDASYDAAKTAASQTSVNALPTQTELPLQKNTGSQHVPFYMRDSTDPKLGKTGVPTITKSLDGAASWSSTTGTVTEIGNGAVDFSPSAADCNGTLCRYKATLTGAVTQVVDIYTHV